MTPENLAGYNSVAGGIIARQPHNNGNVLKPPSAINTTARETTDLEALMDFQNNLSDRMRQVVLRFHDVRQRIAPVPESAQKGSDSPIPSGHLMLMRARFEDQSHLISMMESLCADFERAL